MTGRKRSHWGWGWADKFPDTKTRAQLGQQVQALLGFETRPPIEPVPLEAVELPPPRLDAHPAITTDTEERIRHTYGRSYRDVVRGFRGEFDAAPDAVARPTTEAAIEALLEWAEREHVAVVPWGGGTSVVGGVEGPRERRRVALDLAAFDQVAEIDETSLLARIQGGALGPSLESQLGERGLTLRFYPQSFEFSTLGGWIATRAGGHFATLQTHIDDLTASVRAVTPRGVWQSRPLPGSGAGPSPDRALLGSEGTLGIVTEAWMRVRRRPVFRANASVHFTEFDDAVAAARTLAQSGLHPTNCRLLDKREAAMNFVTQDGSHVLIVGFEGADHSLEHPMTRALEITADHRGTCPLGPQFRSEDREATRGAAGQWKNAFVEAPYLMNTLVSLGVLVDTFETACTWSDFPAMHEDIVRSVRGALKEHCGRGRVSCRFTHVYPDGPAPYYTFLGPARPGAELEQWMAVKTAASDALMRHGGTITHHHAVGRTHRPWYDQQRPAPFAEALRASKHALDPATILNPGVLLD